METMAPRRIPTALIVLACLAAPAHADADGASASAPAPRWPRLVVDTTLAARILPTGGPPTLGPAAGFLLRPTDTHCLHLSGELRADFGRIDRSGPDVVTRGFATTLGALWGSGDADLFVGVGAVFDLGFTRTEATSSAQGFVLTGSMRALVRRHLRKGFHVEADLRVGHTIVAPMARDADGAPEGPSGLVIGFSLGAAFARVP